MNDQTRIPQTGDIWEHFGDEAPVIVLKPNGEDVIYLDEYLTPHKKDIGEFIDEYKFSHRTHDFDPMIKWMRGIADETV